MARKTLTYTVREEGRDQGKAFLITEMPASQAERFAIKGILALSQGGVTLPDDLAQRGWAGLAAVGIRAFAYLSYDDLAPLLDEMMGCVQCVPDPARPEITRALVDSDTEEVETRLRLRREVFELHVDFPKLAALLTSRAVS